MSASFPSAIKSFATRSAGQSIASAIINDLQDEVTAIETAIVTGPITLQASTLASLSVVGASTLAGSVTFRATSTFAGAATFAEVIASAKGLSFPATQVASAGVNTLDDYEEGTWTPTLTNVTIGNGTVTGTYVKIGKWVWVVVNLTWGNTTSAAGTFGFSLPFTATSGSETPAGTGSALDSGTGSYAIQAQLTTTTRIDVLALSVGASWVGRGFVNATSPFTWTTSDQVRFNAFYETTA